MTFYFVWFFITILLLLLSKNSSNKSIISIYILFALVYGCRNYGGIDDRAYISAFYDAINGNTVYGLENSYLIISRILGAMGFNYKAIFLLYSSIAFIFLYLTYKEICLDKNDWSIAILGFFTFSFIPTITVMRQFTATAIIMYALILMSKKKYKSGLFLITMASTIHIGAIVILIVLPIFKIKIKHSIKMLVPILALLAGYFNLLPLILSKISILIPYKYLGYLEQRSKFEIGILYLILIVVYLGQFILGILKKEKITLDKKVDFIEKGQMIYFTLYFISLSNGWINRVSIYFILFIPFLFKTFIDRFNNRKDRQILYIICYTAYIGLYIYQIIQLNNATVMNELIPYSGSFNFIK